MLVALIVLCLVGSISPVLRQRAASLCTSFQSNVVWAPVPAYRSGRIAGFVEGGLNTDIRDSFLILSFVALSD